MGVLNVRSGVVGLLRVLVFGALFYVSLASAQTIPSAASDAAFNRMMATVVGAGQETITYGSGGTVLLTPSAATLAADGAAAISMTRTGSVLNPAGVAVPLTVTGRIAGSTLGPIIAKAIPLYGNISAVMAAYQLGQELGFLLTGGGSNVTVGKIPPGVCNTATCSTFQPNSSWCNASASACALKTYYADQLCALYLPSKNFPAANSCSVLSVSTGNVQIYYGNSVPYFQVGPSGVVPVAPTETFTPTPATLTDLANAIASQSGWPSTSNLPKAAADAIVATGSQVAVATPVVTGPATSAGATTTVNNADGTKTTQSTTYSNAFSGNTMTSTGTTTTNNYNSSNVVTSTSTSTTSNTTPAPTSQNDCQTNPNSVGCTDLGTVPASDVMTTKTIPMSWTYGAFVGGSGCPSPLSFTVAGGSYSVSYQPLCDRMVWLKALLLVMASFIAAYILADSFKV